MDKIIINNYKTIYKANPHYYDYIHNIVFRPDNTFELCDGGGQVINEIYQGEFKIDESFINFNYKYSCNPYDKDKKELNANLKIKYTLINEENTHNNGYCNFKSTNKLVLDKSPFLFDGDLKSRNSNLFNLIEDNSYPLIFYGNLKSIYDK
jgi:hypothetical protein